MRPPRTVATMECSVFVFCFPVLKWGEFRIGPRVHGRSQKGFMAQRKSGAVDRIATVMILQSFLDQPDSNES
jgi:hypothetical protein